VDWIETAVDISPPYAVAAAFVLLAAGCLALVARWPRVRGTTLVAAWYWSVVSLACIVLVEASAGLAPGFWAGDWLAAMRFAAAMTAFCTIMAVLGAKRAQHRAWQFVVLSLWLILSLPSCEWLLFGGTHEIHAARFSFLIILAFVGAGNGLATRSWPSSLLVGLGQLAMISPFCPLTKALLPEASAALLGLLLIVTGSSLVALRRPRRSKSPLDRVWLDFRDLFGVVWGLRVAERINALAATHDWPARLTWHGFRAKDRHACREVPPAAVAALGTLLRRFVSAEWIEERLNDSGPATSAATFTVAGSREQTAAL
jgi:hypothetical protein